MSTDDFPTAEVYEDIHVHQVYQQIASHFSQTRYKPWPVVHSFLQNLTPGSIGLDIGCGNGKYLTVNKSIFIIASDRSSSLIDIAAQHQPHSAIIADTLHLPHANGVFDFAISIAVIHHLSSRDRRVAAIVEMLRVLKVSGRETNGTSRGVNGFVHERTHTTCGSRRGNDLEVLVPLGENSRVPDPAGDLLDEYSNVPDTNRYLTDDKANRERIASSDGPHGMAAGCAETTESPNLNVREVLEIGTTRRSGANGRLLIFAWALEQKGSRRGWDKGDQQDVLVPWVLKEAKTHETQGLLSTCGEDSGCLKDDDSKIVGDGLQDSKVHKLEVPAVRDAQPQQKEGIEGSGGRIYQRYYHLYAKGELQQEVAEAGGKVVEEGYDRDNWWVIVEPNIGSCG